MDTHTFWTILYVCAMPSAVMAVFLGINALCDASPRFNMALLRVARFLLK